MTGNSFLALPAEKRTRVMVLALAYTELALDEALAQGSPDYDLAGAAAEERYRRAAAAILEYAELTRGKEVRDELAEP